MNEARFWEAHRQWLEPPDEPDEPLTCEGCGDELVEHEEEICRYCKELEDEEDQP